jgi:hypothetical protein
MTFGVALSSQRPTRSSNARNCLALAIKNSLASIISAANSLLFCLTLTIINNAVQTLLNTRNCLPQREKAGSNIHYLSIEFRPDSLNVSSVA